MAVYEIVRGKKYKVVVEGGRHPSTGKRRRITKTINGRQHDAMLEEIKIREQLEQGKYIKPSQETVAEYMRHWLKTYAINKAPSTYNGYQRIVKRHIIPSLGHIPLTKLQPMHIQEYYTSRLQEGRLDGKGGLSPNSVIRHHAILREALKHAVRWKKRYDNPADNVEPPSAEESEIYPLEPDQLDHLLATAAGDRNEYLYIVAAHSGMRQGEMLALTWADVSLSKRPVCRVRQTVGYIPKQGFVFRPTAKSKKARREIPQFDVAVEALKKQRQMVLEEQLKNGPKHDKKFNLVFPNPIGKPMDPSDLTRRFKLVAEAAGFSDTRFHDLRHTHATMLLKMGIHPKIVQERLGHQTIGMTMDRYSHVIESMQWDMVDQVNKYHADRNGTKAAPEHEKGHP